MKRFLILFALLFALAIPGAAQSLCTITGTLYDSTGAACNGCRLTISRARSGSTPLSQGSQPVAANASGVVSFTAVQGSFITLTGPFTIGRYNLSGGLEFYVPLQSSATLATLQTAEDALNALISSTTYAPADIPVVTKTASGSLSNEFALGSLATGLLKNTTTTGVPTIAVAGTDYESPLTFAARLNRSVNTIDLATTAVTPGSYTAADITVDAYGRITAAANGSGGGGAVSSVFGRTGAVTAATNDYTWAQIDKTTSSLADLTTRSASDLSSGTLPLARLSGITNTEISNSAAIAYSKLNLTGAILNADLAGSIANAKLANSAITIAGTSTSLGGTITLDTITGLSTTGVVKRTGANTLAIGLVDLTAEVTGDLPFANFVQAGSAGFVGATGAGDYSHRTPSQVTAALDNFVGDSGSGGTKGLVPAPTTGDATKFLKGDGTWGTVSGGGITVGTTTVTSGTNTRVLYNNSGVVGEYTVTGTGNAVLSASPTLTGTVAMGGQTNSGTIVQTSASATAFESGPNGSTNPVFRLVNNVASAATGLSVTGNAAGSGATLTVLSSGTNENLILAPKGTGNINLNLASNSLLTFVGTASNNVALKHTSASGVLQVRTGNDGAYADIQARFFQSQTGGYFDCISTSGVCMYSGGGNINFFSNSAGQLTWGTAEDLRLRRNAAAHLTFGAADAASPVAQTLSVQNVVAGTTNTAGATWTQRGSLGTSQGAPGRIHLQGGAMIAASGTTQQTAVDRIISGATKVLTNNSATTLVNVTNASDTNAGGVIDYCVDVTNGVDQQYECGMVTYGVSNKGGVWSGNTATKFGNHQNATSGTLTVTFAISGANPALLSVNANSSLSPSTGFPRIVYSLRNLTNQAVAIQ